MSPSETDEIDRPDKIPSENPATLKINDKIESISPEKVNETVEKAKKGQKEWEKTPVAKRIEILQRFKDILLEQKEEIGKLISQETGKPKSEAMLTDITPVLDAVRFIEENGKDLLQEEIPLGYPELANRKSKIYREPIGVVGLITPWNYPLGIPGSETVSSLFAGNSVVLKPAEQTSLTGMKLGQLLEKAGVPEDVIHVIPGWGYTTGQALIESDIDHISFTGSTKVGRKIQKTATADNKSVHLELGGSDPAIILDDADLELASAGIVWARFVNAGQTCAAVKRVFVEEGVWDQFKDLVVEKVESLRVGYGEDGNYDMGPLIDENGLEKIKRQTKESVEMGAKVLTGGEEPEDKVGYFFKPTVLENVSPEMPVLNEETFGPVLTLVKVKDEEEAVEMANDTEYGLTASIWTKNLDRGEKLAREVEAGTVMLNEHAYTYGLNATPWGGVKNSGHGRSHGRWGIENVTETKHVHTAKGSLIPKGCRVKDTWWFPYSKNLEELVDKSLEIIYGRNMKSRLKNVTSVIKQFLDRRK